MENDTLIDELNYTFNFNMYLTRSILPNLHNAGDREKVVRWLKKLTTFNTSPDELRIRNDFMYYLVICVQKGALEPPFNAVPPTTGGIEEYAKLLPAKAEPGNKMPGESSTNMDAKKGAVPETKPLIYTQSPDGGAFLAAQPIPRCGAFCYLAVVTKGGD